MSDSELPKLSTAILQQQVEAWLVEAEVSHLIDVGHFRIGGSAIAVSSTRVTGKWVRHVRLVPRRKEGEVHIYWGQYPLNPKETLVNGHDSQTYGDLNYAKRFYLAWLVTVCEPSELPTPSS